MASERVTIIGINPGSRYMGFAVLKGPDLKEWGVKGIKGKTFEVKSERLESILERMFEIHTPHILALKALHPSRSSPTLGWMVQLIRRIARERRIRLQEYSLDQLKARLMLKRGSHKMSLAAYVAGQYPVLFHTLNSEKRLKNSYHMRMFEAVALALLSQSGKWH